MERLRRLLTPPSLTRQDILAYAFVFAAYFIAAKLSLYIFYTFQTSPALIWPPVGIAVAAMIFGGYRMWLPILLAQFLAVITQTPNIHLLAFVIAAAYALQAAVALFVLKRFRFETALYRLRNTMILVAVAFFVTLIEPVIATVAQVFLSGLTLSPTLTIGRAWGAGIFSVLVVTAFLVTWFPWKRLPYTRREVYEIFAAFALLAVNNILLYWTPYPQYLSIAVIFFLPAVLIWFALRLHIRWMTLAIVLTSIVAMAGSIIAHPTAVPLNSQLLSNQIYIGLMAAIFYIFTAVVEERRTAYKRLEEAYQTTSASDKAKNEFIAILAHELRNPLAPIVSSLELLKLQPQSQESLETIRNAEDHAVMIRRLLDDLLDTARLTQKKLKLQKETVSLKEIVDQSIASIDDFCKAQQHTLSITIPEEDVLLDADPVRMKQIVINLLSNACKYTRRGGAIELRAEKHANHILIEVADNGIGIEKDMLPNIFQPFKQVASDERHGTGLGIGLFLTKRLAEMHGGRVTAASEGLGRGSTFSVSIPLSSQLPLPHLEKEVRRLERSASPSRIHIVDDNEAAVLALQKLLRHLGHEVFVSHSGEHALATLATVSPDLILLDIGMPIMDGYETARHIRARGWSGRLVALSGYGQESDRLRSHQAGFNTHLVKPVSVKDILSQLSNPSKSADS